MKEHFLNWLEWSISRVGEGYYGYSERVYCYELYHLMRIKMFIHEKQNGPIDGIFLHSELVKTVLNQEQPPYLEVWPVGPLNGIRIPDFLFHSPGDFTHQIATVEVKVARLSFSDLRDDLSKLSEMMRKYHYQLGVFHCINNTRAQIEMLVKRLLQEKIDVDRDVLILLKPEFNINIEKFRLGQLIDELE